MGVRVYYDYFKTEFDVHYEDLGNYYHQIIKGREIFTLRLPKRFCKIVGNSHLFCSQCGCKYGTKGCMFCTEKKNKEDVWEKGLSIPPEQIKEENLYLHNQLYGMSQFVDNETRQRYDQGTYWLKRKPSYPNNTSTNYFCHKCKYFMWHRLNYCYTCGSRFVQEKLTHAEKLAKYPDYKEGY